MSSETPSPGPFRELGASLLREWKSFKTPTAKDVAPTPRVGDKAPVSDEISFPHGKPIIIVFLRHCGCPFAEKTFKVLTALSSKHPEIHCIAVSHSEQDFTDKWVIKVGGEWETTVIVDAGRELYAQWGLGISSTWHAMSPLALYGAYRLGKDEGIWNSATESGCRWQRGGAFAVDRFGYVRWAKVASRADEIPDLNEAVRALENSMARGDIDDFGLERNM